MGRSRRCRLEATRSRASWLRGHATVLICSVLAYNMPTARVPMQCPICTRPAENLTPNTLDGVVVGCDHCGDYRVSDTAFYGLTRLAAHQRAAALEVAKLGSRAGWPMISER